MPPVFLCDFLFFLELSLTPIPYCSRVGYMNTGNLNHTIHHPARDGKQAPASVLPASGSGVFPEKNFITKECYQCKQILVGNMFNTDRAKRGGLCSACRKCASKRRRLLGLSPQARKSKNRNDRIYKKRNKTIINTRNKTKYYVARGVLKKSPCVYCNSSNNIEAHHPDKHDPFNVIWVCRGCHIKLHHHPEELN